MRGSPKTECLKTEYVKKRAKAVCGPGRPRRGLRGSRGGMLSVEIAVVMPLLLTIMLGILDFAWQEWTSETLLQAATFGARCMGVLQSSCKSGTAYSATATQAYVQSVAQERGITVPTADIVVNNATTCGTASGFSLVTIAYTYNSIVPDFRSAFRLTSALSARACYPNQP